MRVTLDLPQDLSNYVAQEAATMGVTAECFIVGVIGSDAVRQRVSSWNLTDGIKSISLVGRARKFRAQSNEFKIDRSVFVAEVDSLFVD
jgi:hypothetical protein